MLRSKEQNEGAETWGDVIEEEEEEQRWSSGGRRSELRALTGMELYAQGLSE